MTMQITDKDLQQFRERAKTELQSNGAVGRLAWDAVVNALCNEVEELRKNAAPGNAAAMREALEGIIENLSTRIELRRGNRVTMPVGEAKCLVGYVRAALAAPPRNCDVGDASEQSERLAKFCKANYEKAKKDKHICSECQFNDCIGECPLKWAQLPFIPEKGGAE